MKEVNFNVADLVQSVKRKFYEEPLKHTRIVKLEDLTDEDLYEKETDSKGVPILKRVERYPDLPDDVFVPIIYPDIDGTKYKINKKGEILKVKTKKILNGTITVKNYRQSSLLNVNNDRKVYRTHRLVGFTFLINPNYEVYNVVNHIDSDTLNTRISNLEIVTITTNNNPKKKSLKLKGKRISKENETNKLIGYSGYTEDYIWIKHWKYENMYVCKEGYIARFNKSGKLKRVGSLTPEQYMRIHLNMSKTSIGVHKIIMEFLLKRDLNEGEIVDHINCIRYDNSFENLRVTDNIGNMNNPNTLNKYYRKVILTDLYGDFIMYDNSNELHKFIYKDYNKNGAKQDSNIKLIISEAVTYLLANKYFLINPLDKDDLYKKMEIVVYIFSDKNKTNLIGAFDSVRDAARELNISRDIIKRRLNKDLPDKYGNYYMRGPEAVKIVLALGHGTAANFKPEETR